MKLKRTPELHSFLSTYFAETDSEADEKSTRSFIASANTERQQLVLSQAKRLIDEPEFPFDEMGSEANRWFGDPNEARSWLQSIVNILEGAATQGTESRAVVKDSNGTPLNEGDSVTVIKDLKVKGGSSDLKRGTTIKKIHLIGDPDNIECRVDGSTLVLKTCFLKKA
ncbi:MAG: PhnA domain-containing protein [Bdellovibrionota bacterium]